MGIVRRVAFLLILVGLSSTVSLQLSGCSSAKISDGDPAALFQDAESEIKGDRYQLAIDKLRMLKSKFPYSNFAAEAQLRIADVYFLQELYQEAALSYETFRDLHPKHAKAAYALFRVGESYQADVPGNLARDLSTAGKAIAAFEDFVRQYPQDQRLPQARKAISEGRALLAKKELLIGNFYFREGHFDSAKGRFEKILARFPETESAGEARERLQASEEKLKE